MKRPSLGRGFSLVELMVAITIGLIVLAAVSAVLVGSKRSYNTQDRLARLQENGRFAMQFLIKDLRLAGYAGCVDQLIKDQSYTNTLNNPTDFKYAADTPVEGLEAATNVWYPSGATSLPASIEPGTDAVAIRMIDPSSAINITKDMPNQSAELEVNSVNGYQDGEIIMITDCANADLMQITQVQASPTKIQHNPGNSPAPGNATQKLSKSYGPSAKVMKFVTRRYYVRNNPSGNPAMYRDDNLGTAVELVEGIEDLQILYGKDTDGDKVPNIYLPAGHANLSSAADWAQVVNIRVAILARTVNQEDADVDTRTYVVNGKTVTKTGTDRHTRRVFQATAVLRNLQ